MKQSLSHSTPPPAHQDGGGARAASSQAGTSRRPRISETELARWAESKELQPPK
jgi:hypothetical protein